MASVYAVKLFAIHTQGHCTQVRSGRGGCGGNVRKLHGDAEGECLALALTVAGSVQVRRG